MNCHEFWKTLPGEAQDLEAAHMRHFGECPACGAQMDQRRRLAQAMRALGDETQRVGAPPRVEAHLLAAFRRKNGLPAAPRGRPLAGVALWASAAAALAVLALLLLGGRGPQDPQRHPTTMELAVLQDPMVPEESTSSDDSRTGFIPLPNAATLAPSEEVNLVRVELPRAAMMTVGLAVSEERALERVEADVMLGADGLPRAVRFLDE